MKYRHLERFKVTLETVSPVFIGSSSQESLSQKESVLLPREGLLLVPDLNKLIAYLNEKGALEAYEKYLLDETDRKPLREFLQEQSIMVSADTPWVQYHLLCGAERVNSLSRFIKNRQGMPYIPGASVKGAVRTALLAFRGTERSIAAAKYIAQKFPGSRKAGEEEYPLRVLKLNTNPRKATDAFNDLLRSLQISDSAPFGDNSLIVCKKLELMKDGNINGIGGGGGKSAPPLYRECLKPGLKTHFYLTIDRSLAKNQLTMDLISSALKQWMKIQYEYDDRFDQRGLDLKGMQPKNIPIVLGGGVGFQSKSLLMKLKEDRDRTIHFVLGNQFRKRYKNAPDDPAPYRLKLTQYNGGFYPMGRCSLTVEE